MAASTTDQFTYVGTPGTATTLAVGYTIGDPGITVVATTNWPTGSKVFFAIDVVETVAGEEVRVDGTYCEFEGIVTSSTTIGSLTKTYGTAQDYAAGATTRVYIPVSSSRENALVDGLVVEHNLDGTHSDITADTIVVADGGTLDVDTINEATAANGVTIDGLNVKDSKLVTSNSVVTSNVTADAITDAKLVYGKVRSRQGGSATNWGTSGTTTYDYSATDVFVQCGSIAVTTDNFVVTFPTAFNQIPIVMATVASAAGANAWVECTTKSATTATFRVVNSGGVITSETISWMAIGE